MFSKLKCTLLILWWWVLFTAAWSTARSDKQLALFQFSNTVPIWSLPCLLAICTHTESIYGLLGLASAPVVLLPVLERQAIRWSHNNVVICVYQLVRYVNWLAVGSITWSTSPTTDIKWAGGSGALLVLAPGKHPLHLTSYSHSYACWGLLQLKWAGCSGEPAG